MNKNINVPGLLDLDQIGYSPTKSDICSNISENLGKMGFSITVLNDQKPWGAYWVINDRQTDKFIQTFFAGQNLPNWIGGNTLSPKILLVLPGEMLSFQVHERRGELWQVLHGPVGVILSETKILPSNHEIYEIGDLINIKERVNHRLIGLDTIGVVAEIWVHIDHKNPSNEEDLKRLDDKYSRQ